MKCRKCDAKAVINMRQHKLALCRDHFLEWITESTARFIDKYDMFAPDDRVLVAVSGGKDSLALWDVLHKLGYHADGLYIDLGIDGGIGYSEISHRKIEQFLSTRPGLHLEVVDVPKEYGLPVNEAADLTLRGAGKTCSVCGLTKRHIMNRVAGEGGYDVLATGHNLDDEAAVLFGNTLRWQVGYLSRQGPVLPASGDGLARKVKPFCRFYERETAAYALLSGIDYIQEECPYAVGARTIYHKEILNQLEEHSRGAKLQFYLSFLQAKEEGLFQPVDDRVELVPCSSCGQPTTAGGYCAFCRLWDKVNQKL
jgi:uncharacterized protein (TIGR00269 family)